MERVTGIEPAWPAWKALALDALLCWSAGYRPRVVPSACLKVQRAVVGVRAPAVMIRKFERAEVASTRVVFDGLGKGVGVDV